MWVPVLTLSGILLALFLYSLFSWRATMLTPTRLISDSTDVANFTFVRDELLGDTANSNPTEIEEFRLEREEPMDEKDYHNGSMSDVSYNASNVSSTTSIARLNWSDLCVIIISYDKRHRQLVHARDTWLKGVKHFFYSNKANKAIPTVAFENHPGQAHVHWTGNNAGEYRWVPAVHHANVSCRPYKWLLVADDDSYLVLPRVLQFLQGKPYTLPLYLGYAHPPAHGHKGAQCKGWRKRDRDGDQTSCCMGLMRPCWVTANQTPQTCGVSKMDDGIHYQRVRRGAPEVRQPLAPYWHYGGACAMLSVGLFDMIDSNAWLECGRRLVCAGGDRRVGSCIWTLAHIAVTDIAWAGLSQGKFTHAHGAISKLLSLHRITPVMAKQLYKSEVNAGMRRDLTF